MSQNSKKVVSCIEEIDLIWRSPRGGAAMSSLWGRVSGRGVAITGADRGVCAKAALKTGKWGGELPLYTAGAGFAVLLHPHPSHIQKHIPACPNQEFDMFDQCLSSGALGWHTASPQAAMSQARFSCLAAERRGER